MRVLSLLIPKRKVQTGQEPGFRIFYLRLDLREFSPGIRYDRAVPWTDDFCAERGLKAY